MARGSSVVSVAILGDAKKFKRAMDDASSKLGAFGRKAGDISASVVKGLGLMGAAAGGLAVVAGKHLFEVGQELVSLDQKIGTVFSGESLEQVTNWADEVAARMGLTSTQAAGLAANAGDLLKPMGFTADQAASMATEVVGLSGALSEWSGGQRSVEETAEILQKALLGERESLKSLGISINQAQVDTRALAVAQAEGRDEVTAMDRAVATQQLIMESATDAISAYEAGGNQLTAAQNQLKAAFGEVQETIARKLLPVFAKAADLVVELIEVFDEKGLGGVIETVGERLRAAWPQIRNQLAAWARGFVDWVRQVGPPFLAALGGFLVDVGRWFVTDGVPAITAKLAEWTTALVDWAKEAAPPLLEQLGEFIADVANWFSEDGLDAIVTKVGEWAAALVEWVAPMIPPLLRHLGQLLADVGLWIVDTALPNLARDLGEWSAAFIGWVFDVAPDLLRALGGLLASLGGWIIDTGIPSMVRAGLDLGGGLIDGLLNALGATLSGLGGIAKDIINAIIRLFNDNVIGTWNDLSFSALGVTISTPNVDDIQELADGGIVTRPTLALIGEAGPEAVVPLSRGGGGFGGDTYVTVNMPAGANGDDVVRALQDYVRRRGAVPLAVGSARY
jgi:hypothetical protein